MSKRLGLGIDTGGTYTDACLYDFDTNEVLHSAKARTSYHNLALGISQAVRALGDSCFSAVELVSLSTTLATNAMVEGRGGQECLLLIGYDRQIMSRLSPEAGLELHERVRFVDGQFDVNGRELLPVDLIAARRAILEVQDSVDAIGISGYLSVLNPSHELAVKKLAEALVPLPVTCGHELTAQLNSIKRAATVSLNARLIPIIKRLITSVQHSLKEQGIRAPVVVVQGDGSLVRAEVAINQPIQTILSGPAASCVGGASLSNERNCIVVDTGGTTTDTAILQDGVPELDPAGAQVGKWKTSVAAAKIRTTGFGGDSHIQIARNLSLTIGPRRVTPLCMSTTESPAMMDEIYRLARNEKGLPLVQLFDFLAITQEPNYEPLNPQDGRVLDELAGGPLSLHQLARRLDISHPLLLDTRHLESQGIVGRVGLTPTDILHATGRYTIWNTEAARVAVAATAELVHLSPETFAEQVEDAIARKLSLEIVSMLASMGATNRVDIPGCEACATLVELALGKSERSGKGGLSCQLSIDRPLVALGAPRGTYLRRVAELLGSHLVIPPYAEVANAVGAITGNVMRTVRCQIMPVYGITGVQGYRIVGIEEPRELSHLDTAIEQAAEMCREEALEQAQAAGAEQVSVTVDISHVGGSVHLETQITATAVGRPALSQSYRAEVLN